MYTYLRATQQRYTVSHRYSRRFLVLDFSACLSFNPFPPFPLVPLLLVTFPRLVRFLLLLSLSVLSTLHYYHRSRNHRFPVDFAFLHPFSSRSLRLYVRLLLSHYILSVNLESKHAVLVPYDKRCRPETRATTRKGLKVSRT